jgi:hypothetical protein
VLAYFVVANINEAIDFAQLELMGNTMQRPLLSLMEGVENAQVAVHRCRDGSGDCKSMMAQATSQVTQAFRALTTADGQVGTALQFTDEGLGKRGRAQLRVANLQHQWDGIAATLDPALGRAMPADGAVFDTLVADIRGMITHSGDTSNLILDPDLDSYYLMDVTLLALPQTLDRIAKVTILGTDMLQHGISPTDRVQLAVQAAMLQEADLARIVASTQTSLTEDPNFYGVSPSLTTALQPALATYQAAVQKLIDLTNELAAPGTPRVDSATYLAAGVAARAAAFGFWGVAATELDHLLQARIDSRVAARTRALALATLALLAACFLAFLTARSISRPLDKLVASLGPGATLLSQCVATIAEASQQSSTTPAETAIICEELNAHADDMRRAVAELTAQVKGGAVDTVAPAAVSTTASPTAARKVA